MFIIKIQGGLANQLFQYAFGKSLEQKYKIPCYFDLSFFNYQLFRKFELNKFQNISYKTIENTDALENVHHIKEQTNPGSIKYKKNIVYYFDGYWQSENYFRKIKGKILSELSPSRTQLAEIKQKYGHLICNDSVSLHIRRTDYLKKSDVHPVLPVSYYQQALKKINYLKKDYNILIFSDDILWCKENLNFNKTSYIENNDNIIDLFLMSMCKHNIIANSTFSWWAAWLNYNNSNKSFLNLFSKKKVIAPSRWFGENSGLIAPDLIPDSWIKLDV